jgi:hypothetical protein
MCQGPARLLARSLLSWSPVQPALLLSRCRTANRCCRLRLLDVGSRDRSILVASRDRIGARGAAWLVLLQLCTTGAAGADPASPSLTSCRRRAGPQLCCRCWALLLLLLCRCSCSCSALQLCRCSCSCSALQLCRCSCSCSALQLCRCLMLVLEPVLVPVLLLCRCSCSAGAPARCSCSAGPPLLCRAAATAAAAAAPHQGRCLCACSSSGWHRCLLLAAAACPSPFSSGGPPPPLRGELLGAPSLGLPWGRRDSSR